MVYDSERHTWFLQTMYSDEPNYYFFSRLSLSSYYYHVILVAYLLEPKQIKIK